MSVTERDLTESRVQAGAPETMATFLFLENVSPPSPIKELQEIDSDVETSDWSKGRRRI